MADRIIASASNLVLSVIYMLAGIGLVSAGSGALTPGRLQWGAS